MDVLLAATRRPAEMLGIAADVGTVEVGKRADLVVVRGDPLADLRALRRVAWTIRDGIAHTPSSGWRLAAWSGSTSVPDPKSVAKVGGGSAALARRDDEE